MRLTYRITKSLYAVYALVSDRMIRQDKFFLRPSAFPERWRHTVAKSQLRPGLTLIATPIGNAGDITLRALDALRDADAIAAEDTRVARRLMDIHGVSLGGRPLIPYHDHNAASALPRLLELLRNGARVVFLSDAGTPMVADPGYRLAKTILAEGIPLEATPGPCAAIMALTLSGLPSDRFTFAGFPPNKREARRRFLQELAPLPTTLILYESPKRLAASLADMAEVFGPRDAAVARELTKMFEETRRGTLDALAVTYAEDGPPKGEIVVVVGPPASPEPAGEADIDDALRDALTTMTTKDAAKAVASDLGLPRKQVYERALALKSG